ncbi:prepilin-type N-terminal cleavage/methylation domain-containing protein [Myxococcota bacterium]|nr:prepilin-type N-terminal cleavage/methylation domain-containing protein [Myxococcota bacterium]
MIRRRRGARGFTLVEMMIAVAIGSISVVMAAKVAETVMRQNAKSRQQTDYSTRSRLLGHQLRSDLRLAGVGATGAVAVPNTTPLGSIVVQTVNLADAIPVVAGVDNVGAVAVGGTTTLPGSDLLQVLVPNPGSNQRVTQRADSGTNVLVVADASAFAPPACRMVYVVDHSGPTGAGRSQVAFVNAAAGTNITLATPLESTVSPSSDVMCARISTYWVDANNMFHRTDLTGGTNIVVVGGRVAIDLDSVGNDQVAPGALDFQVAYRVSAELYRLAGQPLPAAAEGQWVFAGSAQNPNALMNGRGWFEVRLVRFNLLGRTLRKINETNDSRNYAARENGAIVPVRRNHSADWITSTESVVNLRYFDLGTAERVSPEPF